MLREKSIIRNAVSNIEYVANVRISMRDLDNRTILNVYPNIEFMADMPEGFEARGVVLSSDFDEQLTQLGMLYAFADALVNARSETKESK